MESRRTLAALGAMAVTLGIPAGLVLATSAPAQACIFAVTPPGSAAAAPQSLASGCGTVGVGGTLTITATPTTVGPGDPVTLTATNTTNGADTDVTSQTTFSIDAGSCTGNVCTPSAAGTRTVNAHFSGNSTTASGSTSFTVLAPDHLVISPGFTTATAGQSVAYTVSRVTADGTVIDDVTARATVTIGGAACPGAVCTATTAGQQTVTANLGDLTGGGAVQVEQGPVASLVVTPHVSSVWDNLTPATFTVEAYDVGGNDLGDVTQLSGFTITPDGSCTGNVCTVDAGGSHTVTATYGTLPASVTLDAAGTIPTVVPALPAGQVGAAYSQSVLSHRDDTTWAQLDASSTLPPGLTLGRDGTLSGTPTAAGTYTFFVIAANANGSLNEPTTITIAPSAQPAPPTDPTEPTNPTEPTEPTDTEPTVSIGNASVPEGDHGRTAVHVTVTLSAPTDHPVRVAWHTVNGSAVRGKDYYARRGTITIPAGHTTAQLTVYVLGDRKHESNETFHIVLTRPRGATLGTARGTVEIGNDDARQTIAAVDHRRAAAPHGVSRGHSPMINRPRRGYAAAAAGDARQGRRGCRWH